MSKPPLCPRTPDGASPQRASGDCRGQAEALATAMRRVRDGDFDTVSFPVRWTEKIARLAAACGAARNVLRRGFVGRRAAVRSLAQPAERYRTVLSRKHRCVWIRIPKAASSSILAGLLASDPECEVFSMTSAEFYALRPEARNWFTFAFVRHPFDRALSFWSEIHFASRVYTSRTSPQMYKRTAKLWRCYGLAETLDFDSYCDWLRTPYAADAYTDRHVASQSKPIGDVTRSRRRPLDFIGRLETWEADWARVAAEVGLSCRTLPLLHSLVDWEATPRDVEIAKAARMSLLTSRNRALLAVRYAADLELGGYSPTRPGTVVSTPAVRYLGTGKPRSQPPIEDLSA